MICRSVGVPLTGTDQLACVSYNFKPEKRGSEVRCFERGWDMSHKEIASKNPRLSVEVVSPEEKIRDGSS
jgi:hypothetical protein